MSWAAFRRREILALVVAWISVCGCEGPTTLERLVRPVTDLPLAFGSVRFAVIGDSGSGTEPQYEVGRRMAEVHEGFPFDFVIMLGDNMYGLERPGDYARKFEVPYATLLERGVDFYASLGNHDNPNQRFYEPFHMQGERYYSFEKGNARFFALDSNYMDERQMEWLKEELEKAKEPWKLAFFHHPLYSSGGFHGAELDLRERLEPLFTKHGVRVVFSGHEHFYERIKPQHDVHYFISGSAARLRRGNILKTDITARGFDTDNAFMVLEISGDTLHFEAISRTGERVDAGVIERVDADPEEKPATRKPSAGAQAPRPEPGAPDKRSGLRGP